MQQEFFNEQLKNTLDSITGTLGVKALEYVRNNNPMHNFDRGAEITGQIREKVLHGFALKHHISIDDMRNDLAEGKVSSEAKIHDKYNDAIIYLILEKASFLESNAILASSLTQPTSAREDSGQAKFTEQYSRSKS